MVAKRILLPAMEMPIIENARTAKVASSSGRSITAIAISAPKNKNAPPTASTKP